MSTTKRKQNRTRTVGGSTRAKQRRHAAANLTRLAERIKQAHADAERTQYDSLNHARKAGQLLIEAKEQVPYGEWGSWLDQHCECAESTAGLYMKIAREWDRLADSQRVRKLTLREAGRLLYVRDEGDSGKAADHPEARELFRSGILEPSDLDGLSAIQVQTLVTEVLQADGDFCDERWQARLASATEGERPALEEKMNTVPVLVNRTVIRAMAQDAAEQLRSGKVGHPAVRRLVRPDLRLKHGPPLPGSGGRTVFRVPGPAGRATELPELPITQIGERFCIEAMTLLQERDSGERFTNVARDAIYITCRAVRKAVDAIYLRLGAPISGGDLVAATKPAIAEPDAESPDVANISEPGELVAVE